MSRNEWGVVAIVIFCVLQHYNSQMAMIFFVSFVVSFLTNMNNQKDTNEENNNDEEKMIDKKE